MENLELYDKVREVPKEAQKTIQGGRLKGFTDINPMWRIKTLTENFGPCGVGWYFDIKHEWIEVSDKTGEAIANVIIELYIKNGEEWSKPIVGVGGSRFISCEKNGIQVSDECFKMALTDAISVACKNLGFGADIYWKDGRTKYDADDQNKPTRLQMLDYIRKNSESLESVCEYLKVTKLEDATDEQLQSVYKEFVKRNER